MNNKLDMGHGMYGYHDSIFCTTYIVGYGTPYDLFCKKIKQNYGINELNKPKEADGVSFTRYVEGKSFYIAWTQDKKIDVLLHELIHCVFACLQQRDIYPESKSTGEVYAYYLSSIFNYFYKKIGEGVKP
jgi:hypothetical protein